MTAARFSALRADHTQLRAFLKAMPKGADLHVHLSGAVYAEDFIGWAAAARLCVQRSDYKIVPPDSQLLWSDVGQSMQGVGGRWIYVVKREPEMTGGSIA